MYILEGNIGAGKSTFLKLITKNSPNVSISLEPLEQWHKEEHGQSLLADFYKDPKRWAYTLETLTMISRVKEHVTEQQYKDPWRIMERSIYSGHYCFAKNSFQNGFLTPVEWNVYRDLFGFLTQTTCDTPQGFIYLRVDPRVALERTKKRNRSAESAIPFSYLEQIGQLHDDFLLKKVGVSKQLQKVPVLTLDCDAEFEQDKKMFAAHCKAVEQFLMETCASEISFAIRKTVKDHPRI